MKAHTLMNRQIVGGAAALGLSSGQPKVLEYLLMYGESNQKTIADYCEIEQATVGSILLRMEENGLILREKKAGNRRSLYVTLTEKGRKAAEEMELVFRESEEHVGGGLSEEERLQLRQLLDRLCESAGQRERRREA
ncbi:MarR family transcriptional regulator [Anaerotignum lactatifermentans]|uniref:MarR family transcriptional regulator n=2 Tax=Anaerotignum lactatifermentans TaxID=160404 RepID=A0ABS2G8P9_9FIRM|nr:MarR family transcriptional regulator [Anaerotignum lactatifermentans]MBM6876972.1 MarR family transcriptional regulator [Anaerotignum lactatifermentans]MBM6950530.1 MarR family transcriptional regulator [Anaerotignum lactatifermentans]